MLCDLASARIFLRLTDTSQDALIQSLLPAADRAVKRWCKRDLETSYYTGPNAEYKDGMGYKDLWLLQRPLIISPPGLTGNLTQNSAVITGLSLNAQTYLSVGQPVQVTGRAAQSLLGAFPQGAVIQSVDSATQVTCSAASTQGGNAVPLVFGLRVYIDSAGFAGDGQGGFAVGAGASGAELFLGVNYAVTRDSAGGQSRGALLTRLGGALIGANPFVFWPYEQAQGFLSAREAPYWPRGPRNVRVDYAAGYGVGAPAGGPLPSTTTIPPDLTEATAMVVGFMRTLAPAGVPLDYEAVGRQALLMMQAGDRGTNPMLGTCLQLLRGYREVAA